MEIRRDIPRPDNRRASPDLLSIDYAPPHKMCYLFDRNARKKACRGGGVDAGATFVVRSRPSFSQPLHCCSLTSGWKVHGSHRGVRGSAVPLSPDVW